jgi:hypothetical protein
MYVRRYVTPIVVAKVLPSRAEAPNSRQNGQKNGHQMKGVGDIFCALQVLNYKDE